MSDSSLMGGITSGIKASLTGHATSDYGKAFGPAQAMNDDLSSRVRAVAETALRVSHWIPGVGIATGLVSLALLAGRVHFSGKQDLDARDWGDVIRSVAAISSLNLLVATLDIGATYLRWKADLPHGG